LKYSDFEKLQSYVRIAEYFFEFSDSTSAETYVRKSSSLSDKVDNKELKLRFEVCFARSLDHARKFLQAASKYHWLSLQTGIDESNLLQLLDFSIICAVIGPAGPQRSRILAGLFKDERTRRSAHFDIFQKMYLDRFITLNEKEAFAANLEKHQKAKLQDDFTILDKAIMEHNIVALSKIYETISFESLANFLNVKQTFCEKTIHSMISEKRLDAVIDQVEGYIDYRKEYEDYNNWSEGINNFCTSLDKLINKIATSAKWYIVLHHKFVK